MLYSSQKQEGSEKKCGIEFFLTANQGNRETLVGIRKNWQGKTKKEACPGSLQRVGKKKMIQKEAQD